MRESGMDRTLRYFIRMAEQYVLYAAGLSFAMTVYMWFINGSSEMAEMLYALPGTLLYMSGMVLAVTGTSVGQQWYSMLISLGCRRKNVFLGSIIVDTIYILECVILYRVLSSIFKTDFLIFTIPIALAFYLLLGGVSKACGAALLKWGRKARFIYVLLIMAFSLLFGLWSGFTAYQADMSFVLNGILTGTLRMTWQLAIVLAAAAVYAASGLLSWRILRNYEVRA